MLKRYTFWLWAAVIFQLLTAAVHSLSFVVTPELNNDTERQFHELITTYRADMGGGFRPTFSNLFMALSSCFTFVCLLGGMINAYLLKKRAGADIIRGVTLINVIVFGSIFVVMAFLTFLPPIICTALIFICLLAAWLLNRDR